MKIDTLTLHLFFWMFSLSCVVVSILAFMLALRSKRSSHLTVCYPILTCLSVSVWREVWLLMTSLTVCWLSARTRLPFILTYGSMCQGGRVADVVASRTSRLASCLLHESGSLYATLSISPLPHRRLHWIKVNGNVLKAVDRSSTEWLFHRLALQVALVPRSAGCFHQTDRKELRHTHKTSGPKHLGFPDRRGVGNAGTTSHCSTLRCLLWRKK